MSSQIDCAILNFTNHETGSEQPATVHANGRLHLHKLRIMLNIVNDVHALMSISLVLRRFDAALLHVDQNNLAWARQALTIAQNALRTPIIGLTSTLKAPAIKDLFQSGMSDFVRGPLCTEELRARIERIIKKKHRPNITSYPQLSVYGERLATQEPQFVSSAPQVFDSMITTSLDCAKLMVLEKGENELEAFAQASAVRGANIDESFNKSKAIVVRQFERAYIIASLVKSSGNIALAARNAKKHRRAYWALMQKHKIDASNFRNQRIRAYNPEDG